VRAFQVVHGVQGIRIRFTSDSPLGEPHQAEIRGRLRRIHPELEGVEFVRVERLPQTLAGKTRMVVAE
jgi:hypothetical protein